MKTKAATVHVIAVCSDCGWRSENYLTGKRLAGMHYKRTGHEISVEVGQTYRYKREDRTAK